MSEYFLVFVALALTSGLTVAWWLTRREGRGSPATALDLAFAYGVPALIFAAFVAWISGDIETTRVRFALLGAGFQPVNPAAHRIAIGGDRDVHDLWVAKMPRDAPTAWLRLDPDGISARKRLARLEFGADVANGIVTLGSDHLVRGVRLLPEDEIRAGETTLTVADDPWRLVFEGGATKEIPRRRGNIIGLPWSYEIWRPRPVRNLTHPLQAVAPGPNGLRRSFFYQEPHYLGAKLYLAVLDADVEVHREQAPIEVASFARVENRSRLHVNRAPLPGGDFKAGGITDLRSFSIRSGSRSLALDFDTPEIVVLRWPDLRALGREDASGDITRINLTFGAFELPEGSVHLTKVGRRVEVQTRALLEFGSGWWGPAGFRERLPFDVVSPSGARDAREGEPFWLGRSHLAAIQVDRLSPSAVLGLAALILAVLKGMAARGIRLSRWGAAVALVLESLLAIRLLLGFRCWAMPPFSEEAQQLSSIAFVLLPWSVLLAASPVPHLGRRGRRDLSWLPVICGGMLAATWSRALAGGSAAAWVWVALVALAALVPWLRTSTPRALDVVASGLQRIRVARGGFVLWLGLAVLVGGARSALAVIGFKEGIHLGGSRLSLDLVHVPLALVLVASFSLQVWLRVRDGGSLALRDPVIGIGIYLFSLVVPAFVLSDIGLAMLSAWPLALLTVSLVWATWREEGRKSVRARIRSIGAVVVALVALYAAFMTIPSVPRVLLSFIPEATQRDLAYGHSMYVRLLQFADPDRLQTLGIRTSEEHAVLMEIMRVYAGQPATGRGMGGSQITRQIENTAMRENAPGVFVAAEAGVLGSLGMGILYGLCACAGWTVLPWHRRRGGRLSSEPATAGWAALGGLALFAFALPSFHMWLANYGYAPFTGKNVYLLGLDSKSDLIATWTFFVLAAAGGATARHAESGR